jgi:hypothetical protein
MHAAYVSYLILLYCLAIIIIIIIIIIIGEDNRLWSFPLINSFDPLVTAPLFGLNVLVDSLYAFFSI